jgi:hypothetical protein
MNKEFFQPRGLYCLLMTWNPELPDAPATTIDLRHKFKSSDGKAYGNIFPEVAPLVFPQIDQLASDQDAEKKFAKMKKKKEFVAGYMDKRAQAKFVSYPLQIITGLHELTIVSSQAAEHPDSHLTQGPKPTFTSRYADPNHAASSGDPLALITGGHLTMNKQTKIKDAMITVQIHQHPMADPLDYSMPSIPFEIYAVPRTALSMLGMLPMQLMRLVVGV